VTTDSTAAATVWDPSTGRVHRVLREPGGGVVTSAVFSPNGRQIATSSEDGTARVWVASTGKDIVALGQECQGHYWPLYRVAWNPDGTQLVTAGMDGVTRVWDVRLGSRPTGATWKPWPLHP
jgi:WD40 repeat protein